MFFRLLWIFFIYSFAGWVIETTLAIIKQKRFVNRGVLNGPLCTIYGVVAIIITLTQRELLNNIPFLFLFCAIYATVAEARRISARKNQPRQMVGLFQNSAKFGWLHLPALFALVGRFGCRRC